MNSTEEAVRSLVRELIEAEDESTHKIALVTKDNRILSFHKSLEQAETVRNNKHAGAITKIKRVPYFLRKGDIAMVPIL
jgi:hypothetical protein